MKILIVGTGYVGLVSGACFSQMGHEVICLDIDKDKINKLKKADVLIYEPGLKEIVNKNIKEKRLSFTTDYKKGVLHAEVIFLCLPTPSLKDGSCNTSFLQSAIEEIATHINTYKVIVVKSTAPIGTVFKLKKLLKEKNNKASFDIVSNPEFLKEGNAVFDCMRPDRIIIGADSEKAKKIMRKIYLPFMVNEDKLIEMDILSSELTKYASNSMLALRISFMNEISKICEHFGANINLIRKGIGTDGRIGKSFLYAGAGYGGSCFPKDIRALISISKKNGYLPEILQAIENVNIKQKKSLFQKIKKYFKEDLANKTITIWGLSFKPDTDDMRDAPSLVLIEDLLKEEIKLRLFDPVSMKNAQSLIKKSKKIYWAKDELDAVKNSDAIVLLTEWKQFRLIDFNKIKNKMRNLVIFDFRNQYNQKEMIKNGFDYISIGVPNFVH